MISLITLLSDAFKKCAKMKHTVFTSTGNIEDLDGINNKNLYEYHTDCLKSCPIDIFVMGDVNEQEITDRIEKQFYFERGKVIEVELVFQKR